MKKNFIANELKLSYHKNAKLSIDDFKCINNSKQMDRTLRRIWDLDELEIRESFYALYFNTKPDVIGYQKIADGGLDTVRVDMRLIMSSALLCNATSKWIKVRPGCNTLVQEMFGYRRNPTWYY